LGARDLQKIVALVNPRVCDSYQSVTDAGVTAAVAEPPVVIPELLTKRRELVVK
jgi:hypothetical protein